MNLEYIKTVTKIVLFWSLFALAGYLGKEWGLTQRSISASQSTNQLFGYEPIAADQNELLNN